MDILPQWLAAIADEMDAIGASLLCLQETPFLGDTSDPSVMHRVVVALQDLDRLTQTAQGLAAAARAAAEWHEEEQLFAVAPDNGTALDRLSSGVRLQSLRDRLLQRTWPDRFAA